MFYTYRCTEDKLPDHLNRIAEAGDEVVHVIFKGSRDYLLVCRAAEPPTEARRVGAVG